MAGSQGFRHPLPQFLGERTDRPGLQSGDLAGAGQGVELESRAGTLTTPAPVFLTGLPPVLSTTPSDGVARQRGSDVREGLLICQPPADTCSGLLPAYPGEGRGILPADCQP